MCLSLFLFLSVCLIMPMKLMDRQRQIQGVMEAVGEELSRLAYVEYCFREDGKVDTGRAEEGAEALGGTRTVTAWFLPGGRPIVRPEFCRE